MQYYRIYQEFLVENRSTGTAPPVRSSFLAGAGGLDSLGA
jgi:hypothetical protein